MPLLLHLSDVHLGARHRDLGEAAARQRERQAEAFARAVEVGLERNVDAVLVCGDLFDSNAQPRRTVVAAAAQLRRLTDRGIHVALIPGTHDCYDERSIYRAFDLAAMCGLPPESELLRVLVPERPDLVVPELDLVIYGRIFATKRAPRSPLADFTTRGETRGHWKVAMVHGSRRVPGVVESDDVIFGEEEIAASGLDYLALGHWHSFQQGRAGGTTWAYSGAPEPVAVDQDGAGQVCLVHLEQTGDGKTVRVETVTVGRTRFRREDVDAATLTSEEDLVARLQELADPDLVLRVRLVGVAPDHLEVIPEEVCRRLAGSFLHLRLQDTSVPTPSDEGAPPPDTVAGAFVAELDERLRSARERGDRADEADALAILRLGRLLLLDDPSKVTLA
jgi:DNA repair protein SbcD/Mre11